VTIWPLLLAFRRRQFRMTYKENGSNNHSISPWHDIPIKLNETDGVLYMRVVVEIPKGETAKVETWVSSHSMDMQVRCRCIHSSMLPLTTTSNIHLMRMHRQKPLQCGPHCSQLRQ
jgi:hypothetical protein